VYFTASLRNPFPNNNTSSMNKKWDRNKYLPNLMHFMIPLLWYEFNSLVSSLVFYPQLKKGEGIRGNPT